MSADVLGPIGEAPGPQMIGDTVFWVDNSLRGKDTATQRPVCSRELGHMLVTSKEASFADELVAEGVVSIAESERCSMSLAEREQCLLDNFWGMFVDQTNQAKARGEMEEEDRRSRAVQTKIEREAMHALWDADDLRKREAKSVVRESVEVVARKEYLEIFHNTPSTGFVIDYRWPTRAVLPQACERRSPNIVATAHDFSTAADALGVTPALSMMYYRKCRDPNWGSTTANFATEKGAPTLPLHTFLGRKSHSLLFAQDLFVPPRNLGEPSTKLRFIPSGALGSCPFVAPSAPCLSTGLVKAVHLPPLVGTPRDDRSRVLPGSDDSWNTRGMNAGESNRAMLQKPGAPGQPLRPSFERKLAAWCAVRSEEAQAEAEERWRSRGRGGIRLQGWGGQLGLGGSRGLLPRCRQQGRASWRDRESYARQRAIELVSDREEELLTRIFEMVDVRDQGEIRLDEVLFHMKENAQVKSKLKHLTLWTMIKTRQWEWLEELFAEQDGPALTLSALLDYSRSLRQEKGVPRKHVRLPEALRREEEGTGVLARLDARSKIILPTDFVEGQEVEALFMKGFQWYRAWIVRCHPDDTFDVRFTPPSPTSMDGSSREGKTDRPEEQQHPEIDTPSTFCYSESSNEKRISRDDTEAASAEEAGEEWRKTCERVAQFIGITPDLGVTETEVLEETFDAIVRLTRVVPAQGIAQNSQDDAPTTDEVGGGGPRAADKNGPREKHSSKERGGYQLSTGTSQQHQSIRRAGGKYDRLTSAEARVPASEVLRLLRAGMLEDYRRASPALSATYIYREFAEGLRVAAECRSIEGYECACDGHDQPGGESTGIASLALSKAEFCEYFEAVTDLVDLNGLSLTLKRPP